MWEHLQRQRRAPLLLAKSYSDTAGAAERGRQRNRRMLCRFVFTAIVGVFLAAEVRAAVEEYQLKAVFLYNFAKFVEWPEGSFRSLSEPITVCILGQNPFGPALVKTLEGKAIDGRPFRVREIPASEPGNPCHILFVSASERKRFRSLLPDRKGSGTLTVGESPGFAAEGGVVNFRIEGNTLRIEVNTEAARLEHLRISAKLLNLVEIVK